METHTERSILPCGICEYETRKKVTLDEHIKSKHVHKSTWEDGTEYSCEKYEKNFGESVALNITNALHF